MDILQGMRKLVLYGPSNYSCNVKLIQLYKKKADLIRMDKARHVEVFVDITLYLYR